MATAADVGSRWDVVINGVGYMLLETEQKQATFSFAPTFLERTNVSQAYGDDDQDFWLTMSQKDWSLGEGQRAFAGEDADSQRRYWVGESVDISVPGSVTLRPTIYTKTAAAAIKAVLAEEHLAANIAYVTSSNLYSVDTGGNISDLSAHGCSTPGTFGSLTDGSGDYYIAGVSKVRKYDGASYSDFDGSNGSFSLAFLNNALYGMAGGSLVRWSTAGAMTTLFTWRGADGVATGYAPGFLHPFGGDLAIVLQGIDGANAGLWIYDGVAPAKVAQFTRGFAAVNCAVVNGTLFIGGAYLRAASSGAQFLPAVYAFAGGSLTEIWRAASWLSSSSVTAGGPHPFVVAFAGGCAWNDDTTGRIKFYEPETGAISTLFPYTVAGDTPLLAAGTETMIHTRNQTTFYQYPHRTTYATSGFVTTSLFDGSTTRNKRFKSVVVEWDAGTDGDGGSIDIAYRINDVDGSYTSLQTGAVSGTEYAIGQVGRSISIKVTLNKGTSTYGPRLKRIYVRAAPTLDSFRLTQYVLNLTGRDGKTPLALRDGTFESSDGLTLATALTSAIQSTTAISITDEFGTYTAILDPAECQIVRVRPQEYVAIVQARQV